jgi:2-dehydro-3-deoxy-D-arabinonate dehydratase
VLLTGTGIVPPDEFTLQPGQTVEIRVPGIGLLRNPVAAASKEQEEEDSDHG